MWDDVLHNQCVQDMDVDRVMVVEVDRVMVVEVDRVMVVEVETVQLEINTKDVVQEHHMEDKVAITRRSGSLTLKDRD